MSQPANTEISVKRTVRAYRQDLRHESVHAVCNRLRPLVMSVPAEETLVVELSREADTDEDIVTTALIAGRGTGLPIVRGLRPVTTFAVAVSTVTNLDFPIRIGSDVFLTKADTNLSDDLHQNLRDVV